jgi:hypothetical protein
LHGTARLKSPKPDDQSGQAVTGSCAQRTVSADAGPKARHFALSASVLSCHPFGRTCGSASIVSRRVARCAQLGDGRLPFSPMTDAQAAAHRPHDVFQRVRVPVPAASLLADRVFCLCPRVRVAMRRLRVGARSWCSTVKRRPRKADNLYGAHHSLVLITVIRSTAFNATNCTTPCSGVEKSSGSNVQGTRRPLVPARHVFDSGNRSGQLARPLVAFCVHCWNAETCNSSAHATRLADGNFHHFSASAIDGSGWPLTAMGRFADRAHRDEVNAR